MSRTRRSDSPSCSAKPCSCARIGSAAFDPQLQIGEFAVFEFPLRRHLQIAIGVADCLPQVRGIQFARLDGRAGIATRLPASTRIEAQAAFLLLGAMAVDAVLDEQRADALLKMRHVRSTGGGGERSEKEGTSDHRGCKGKRDPSGASFRP